jgi:hypothetical protein
MRIKHSSSVAVVLAALGFSPACTWVTGSGDYKLGSAGTNEDSGVAGSVNQDLDFTLSRFTAHAGGPIDIAVASSEKVLQARAVVLLAPVGTGSLPDEHVTLTGVLLHGENQLYFFADTNRNGIFDPPTRNDAGEWITNEHSWALPVPTDGVVVYVHQPDFSTLQPDAFAQQGDVVFRLPEVPAGILPAAQKRARAALEAALGAVTDIRVVASDTKHEMGLYRRHAGSALPMDELRLRGIADSGSSYEVELLIDGKQVRATSGKAPSSGDLVFLPDKWLPSDIVNRFRNTK